MMNAELNPKALKNLLCIWLLFCISCTEQKLPQVTFDVPALMGKNIDEVRHNLGKPLESQYEPRNFKVSHYENTYDNAGQELLISFNPHSRKIYYFFVVSSIKYDLVKDILKVANLDSLETKTYLAEPEYPFNSKAYNSVKIRPK